MQSFFPQNASKIRPAPLEAGCHGHPLALLGHVSLETGRASRPRPLTGGFTIIELLIAIVLIGMLASVVLVNMNVSRIKSRNTQRMSDLTQIQFALEQYYDDALCSGQGCYPFCQGSLVYCYSTQITGPLYQWNNMGIAPNYIPSMPRDPTNNAANNYVYYYVRGYRKISNSTYQCVTDTSEAGCVNGNPATDYILLGKLESYSGGPTYSTVSGTSRPIIGPDLSSMNFNVLLGNQ